MNEYPRWSFLELTIQIYPVNVKPNHFQSVSSQKKNAWLYPPPLLLPCGHG